MSDRIEKLADEVEHGHVVLGRQDRLRIAQALREMREALLGFTVGAGHTRIFLTTTEKMHPDGVALYDEAVQRAHKALQEPPHEQG